MDTPIGQMIIMSVTIMFIGIVVLSQFVRLKESRAVEAKSSSAIVELAAEYDDPWKQSYDGLVVSGSEVLDEIKRCIVEGEYSVVFTNTTLAEAKGDYALSMYGIDTEQEIADGAAKAIGYLSAYRFCKTRGGNWSLVVDGTTTSCSKGGPGTNTSELDKTATYRGYIYRDPDDVIRMIVFVKQ